MDRKIRTRRLLKKSPPSSTALEPSPPAAPHPSSVPHPSAAPSLPNPSTPNPSAAPNPSSVLPVPATPAVPVAPVVSVTPAGSITSSAAPVPLTAAASPRTDHRKRYQAKLETLVSRRTGVEQRQRLKASKDAQSGKPKNAIRHMAREGLHELLTKVGVSDAKVETELMNDIARGQVRTADQLAQLVVQKLQRYYPRGPPAAQPGALGTLPVPAGAAAPVGPVSGGPAPAPPVLSSSPSLRPGGRKPLKRPTLGTARPTPS